MCGFCIGFLRQSIARALFSVLRKFLLQSVRFELKIYLFSLLSAVEGISVTKHPARLFLGIILLGGAGLWLVLLSVSLSNVNRGSNPLVPIVFFIIFLCFGAISLATSMRE